MELKLIKCTRIYGGGEERGGKKRINPKSKIDESGSIMMC